jgi:hypothetical protein
LQDLKLKLRLYRRSFSMLTQLKPQTLRSRLRSLSKSRDFRTLAAVCTAAGVTMFMSPSKAITMAFCGMFMDGGTIDGAITFDPLQPDPPNSVGSIFSFVAVTTTSAPGSAINWTEANFKKILKSVVPNTEDNPNLGGFGGGVSRQYQFEQGSTQLFINIPESFYPDNFPLANALPTDYNMAEYRPTGDPPIMTWRKDPDKLRTVPGPFPIFGAAAAFGFVRKARSISKRLTPFSIC